jgi:hypothetical protein
MLSRVGMTTFITTILAGLLSVTDPMGQGEAADLEHEAAIDGALASVEDDVLPELEAGTEVDAGDDAEADIEDPAAAEELDRLGSEIACDASAGATHDQIITCLVAIAIEEDDVPYGE